MRKLTLILALALLALAGFGDSASAAVVGLERVPAETALDSQNKSATATCPAGKQLIGTGGEISSEAGSGGQLTLNDILPNAALTSVTVQGLEDQNGTTANWITRAFAICAFAPPGLERVVATSPSNSSNKSVSATCPTGKRVLGTGSEISGGGGEVAPGIIRPNNLTSVTVQGLEDETGTAANWLVRAVAICANPVAGLERVAATSFTGSPPNTTVIASCPAGKQVLTAGGELGGSGGGQVVLDELRPNSGLPSVTVEAFEDETGAAANWFVRAIAICAAVSQRNTFQGSSDSLDKAATAGCPAGMQVTGGGGDITGGGGQVLLQELEAAPTSFGVNGFEDENGFAGDWSLRAYAICATPLPGQEVVAATSVDTSENKSQTVNCPAGKRVIGTSARVNGAPGEIALEDIAPNAGLTSVTASASEDETGTTETWQIGTGAVCANPPPGLELVTAETEPDSDTIGVTATCPAGKNLLGTGAEIEGGTGQVVLDDLRPNATLTSTTVTGLEDENGFAGLWSVRAHAICASP